MVGDPVRVVGADVGQPQDVDQQLGQLVGLRRDAGDGLGQRLVTGLRGQGGVLVADHADTGSGRADHGVVRREGLGVPPDQRIRLRPVAGVDVHLTAAGLGHREVDVVPEPLEQPHHRLARLRERRVVDAREEQADAHRAATTSCVVCGCRPHPSAGRRAGRGGGDVEAV